MTNKVDVNGVYTGEVTKVLDFGAFVEILPGVEGLLHVSQIAEVRIGYPKDVLEVGSEITVECIEFENENKIRLTMKGQPQQDAEVAKKLEKIIAEGGSQPPRRDNRRPRRDGDRGGYRGRNSRGGDRGGYRGNRNNDSRGSRDGGGYRGNRNDDSRGSRNGGGRNFGSGERRQRSEGGNRRPSHQGRRLNRS